MGFLKGVKSFSSCVIACSKKLKSKTPGFLKGVSRISRRCVRACSRKSKSKTPKADPACTACSSRESKSETPKKEEPQFVHITLKVSDKGKRLWMDKVAKVDKLMNECGDGLRSTVGNRKDSRIEISGTIKQANFIPRLRKLEKGGHLEVDHFQIGNCSTHLFRKKEAPSTKNTNPSTNNANPQTNNANTTVGYYHPQGYGSYYGNGGYNNVGLYGNGGYDGYFAHNGGYNGNSYNYQPEPAVYQRRIGYDHIDCAGDASECSGHHNANPDKTQDKSSENTVPKPAGSHKRN